MSYDNTNRGVLFKNNRKERDNQPDYTGKIDVGGTEYELAAWIKEGKAGKFMSLSVKSKDDRPTAAPAPAQRRAAPIDIDDDVPY